MLQPHQFARRLLDEQLDGVLVAQPVPAGDRVVCVLVETVVFGDDARRAPSADTVWLRIG